MDFYQHFAFLPPLLNIHFRFFFFFFDFLAELETSLELNFATLSWKRKGRGI